jgi:probable phosphoglycerate mutase
VEITLVRHAQPDWEPGGSAVDEPTLTALGFEQSRCTAERLRGESYDALYVSPLQRTRETAAPIAEALGLEPEVLPWLRELELPSLEGHTPEQVQAFFRGGRLRPPEAWWNGYEGGESFRRFYERVSGGIDALLEREHRMQTSEDAEHRLWHVADWDARILVVAHEGTISVLTAHLLGLSPNPWTPLRFSIGWTGIARLHTAQLGDGAVWSLAAFNQTEHLAALNAPSDGTARRSVA